MGVDSSREAIARARRLTRVANRAFSEGVAQALDAPDGSYDIVVSSLVVNHLPDTLRPPGAPRDGARAPPRVPGANCRLPAAHQLNRPPSNRSLHQPRYAEQPRPALLHWARAVHHGRLRQ
jgi:hypothetical protein